MDKEFWLVICGTGSESGTFRIDDGHHLIGRSEGCDIRLQHWSVSRQHALIVNDDGRLLLRDLGSQNGTFVDGKPVQSATIEAGSSLRIGDVMLDIVDHRCNQGGSPGDDATPRAPVRDAADACLRTAGFGPARTQVLSLLLDGLAEKQIAAKLAMRERTVHWHTEEIYDALGVHSRGELSAHFRHTHAISTAYNTVH